MLLFVLVLMEGKYLYFCLSSLMDKLLSLWILPSQPPVMNVSSRENCIWFLKNPLLFHCYWTHELVVPLGSSRSWVRQSRSIFPTQQRGLETQAWRCTPAPHQSLFSQWTSNSGWTHIPAQVFCVFMVLYLKPFHFFPWCCVSILQLCRPHHQWLASRRLSLLTIITSPVYIRPPLQK